MLKKQLVYLVVFFCFIYSLKADFVNSTNALQVASFHLKLLKMEHKFSLEKIQPYQIQNDILFYVVDLQPLGFMLVNSDTNLVPILSYSFVGTFNVSSSPKNIILHIAVEDVKLRRKAVSLRIHPSVSLNNDSWVNYLEENFTFFESVEHKQWPAYSESITGGWIQTDWEQKSPYNIYCPIDPITGRRTNIGSAGFSIAQVINYFRYLPSVSFSEQDNYTTNNNITIDTDATQYDFISYVYLNDYLKDIHEKYENNDVLSDLEIAALNYAAAISVNAHFNDTSFDNWTWDISHALRNKFGFSNAKTIYSDDSDIFSVIKSEVKQKMPVITIVSAPEEMCIITDGMNTMNEFHILFGWKEDEENAVSAWYHFSEFLPTECQIISQVIASIGENVSSRFEKQFEKIEIEKDDLIIDYAFNEDIKEEKPNALEQEISSALEDSEIFGKTPRFVVYEESPIAIKQIPPEYPNRIKRSGIHGTVMLEVEVLESGKVGAVEVVNSVMEGRGGLDEAAVNAVKQWEFSPAKNGGKPVACWVRFPIVFELGN